MKHEKRAKRAKDCVTRCRELIKKVVGMEYDYDTSLPELKDFDIFIKESDYVQQIIDSMSNDFPRPINDYLSLIITPSSVGSGFVLYDKINKQYVSLSKNVEW